MAPATVRARRSAWAWKWCSPSCCSRPSGTGAGSRPSGSPRRACAAVLRAGLIGGLVAIPVLILINAAGKFKIPAPAARRRSPGSAAGSAISAPRARATGSTSSWCSTR